MILQALKEYYERKLNEADSGVAAEGFENKEIPFVIVIKNDGTFVNLEDTREKSGKKLIGKIFQVPRSCTRTGTKAFEKPFLLWDHTGFVLGHPKGDQKAEKQHSAWRNMLQNLPQNLKEEPAVGAIIKFYEKNEHEKVFSHQNWNECLKVPSCNMTFRLAGETTPVPCLQKIKEYVIASLSSGNSAEEDEQPSSKSEKKIIARCLITGEIGEIARTHGRTPINKDTKRLVSFQKNSGYDSYGKEQCYNAPVSKSAEFAYTTGLNILLKNNCQKIKIGDAVTVFWSAKKTKFEEDAILFFSEPSADNPDQNTEAILSLYNSIWNGTYILPDEQTKFYVLGLSPNSARISVRFWYEGTVHEIGQNLLQYINDLKIVCPKNINPALPMNSLLLSISPQRKFDNIPPNLAGEFTRSILEKLPFPDTLLDAAVRRNRAEQSVPYPRAALIKACVNRKTRFYNPQIKEELKMSLDKENTKIGYRLGRLFATLEKIQQEANPGINATIRDRFYGAASGTPVAVFPNLMRLKNHHLAKLENTGRKIYFEKLIGEIMEEITDFPAHLPIGEQGRFAVGYYHQQQDFFTKKEDKN